MTHQDQASVMLKASRPEIEKEFGITIAPRGEAIIGDYELRSTKYYRDQLRYNAAKWELGQAIIAAFSRQRRYDNEVLDALRSAQRDLESEVKEAADEWYRGQASKKNRTPFEPSFASFRATFRGLRRSIQECGDRRVRAELEMLNRALTHLSHNEFPAEALGFDLETPEQRKARLAEKKSSRSVEAIAAAQEQNRIDGEALFEIARARMRNNRRIVTSI